MQILFHGTVFKQYNLSRKAFGIYKCLTLIQAGNYTFTLRRSFNT